MTSIRFYNDEDYEQVKEILLKSEMYDETWEKRSHLKRKIERDHESIIVACEENKIIGCIFIVEDGWNAFLWRLCVKESARKKGTGAMLMKHAEEILRKRGVEEVSMFVNPKKILLQEWYEKQDYKKGNDWTFMYKEL